MRKIREVLRLRREADLSVRQISVCTKVSVGSIQKLLKSAQTLGLTWPLPSELDDGRLAVPVLSAGQYHHLGPLCHTGLALCPSGTQAQEGLQTAALGGVHPALPQQLLQLLPVLRPLQVLMSVAKALHAPDPQSEGKALYRLLRAHGAHCFADYE